MKRIVRLLALAALGACTPAKSADDAAGNAPSGGSDAPAAGAPAATPADVPVSPEKPGPAALSDAEQKELAASCTPLTTAMIEADSAATHLLDDTLRDNPKAADADDKALAVALDKVKKSKE